MSFISQEPAFFYGLVQAVVAAGLNVAVVVWGDLSADAVAAINGFVLAITALILSLVTRSKVTPVQ